MIFRDTIDFNYIIDESKSIYHASNHMTLKRFKENNEHRYTLTIISEDLKLIANGANKKKYQPTKFGGLSFKMKTDELKLNFVTIELSRSLPPEMTTLDARLLVVINNMGDNYFEFRERSSMFTVLTKPDNISIIDKKKQKTYSLQSRKLVKKMEEEAFGIIPDNNQCEDDSVLFAEEESSRLSDSVCLIFNFIDFDKNKNKKRDYSVKDVHGINSLFDGIDRSVVKIASDDTKKDFFEDIRDFIKCVDKKRDQVFIFIMSHGKDGGFFTRDEFVTENEFHECLEAILYKHGVKTLCIQSYCRSTVTGPSFGSSQPESLKNKSNKDDTENFVVDDVISKRFVDKYRNLYITHSTKLGDDACWADDGSLYIKEIILEMNDRLKFCSEVNLVSAISDISFENITFLKTGKHTQQFPQSLGAENFEMIVKKCQVSDWD